MRKRSGTNFDELLNKEWSIISRNQYNQLQVSFKKADQKNGGVSFYDMLNLIRSIGITISEERRDKIIKELSVKEIKILDFTVLLNTSAILKREREENSKGEVAEENQYLDSFVALGGKSDKSGYVSKSTLIDVVKKQFQLALDLENLIEGLQGENLDYETFCSIFEQDKEKGNGRLASAASQRSLRSNESARSIAVDEKDFQKFLSQFENEESYS